MASLLEQAVRLYEGVRRSARPLHPIVREMARIWVRAYAKLKRFQLPPDAPYNYLYLTGMYEPGTTMIVNRLLKPGMVAVDVGAHVGYYTRLFARLVGKHGKVYAFEPTPKTFVILEHNTRIFPNVNRFNMAVLDREAVVELYESINSGTNSFWPNNTRGTPTGSVLVKAMPLDKVLSDVYPHLVKLDVEGAELEVLRGMRNLLSRSINLTLIVEWNPSCLVGRGVNPDLLIETIGGLGFEISAIDEVTGRVEPANIHVGGARFLEQGPKYINFLCTRR